MSESFWLAGALSEHRRGLIIKDALGTNDAAGTPPEAYGLCLMFGSEFQDGDAVFQKQWLDWSQAAGRTLLLIPPLTVRKCSTPVQWEVIHRSGVQSKNSFELLEALAAEVRYELRGKLQTLAHLGGAWSDYAVNTAYYRKHAHSGVFAVTCLPLWSLTVLDRRSQLKDWLSELQLLAGVPSTAIEEEQETFKPTKEHYAMLLHLLSGKFQDPDAALSSLETSEILKLAPQEASRRIRELEANELIEGAAVTEAGLTSLRGSPFAIYEKEFADLGTS